MTWKINLGVSTDGLTIKIAAGSVILGGQECTIGAVDIPVTPDAQQPTYICASFMTDHADGDCPALVIDENVAGAWGVEAKDLGNYSGLWSFLRAKIPAGAQDLSTASIEVFRTEEAA